MYFLGASSISGPAQNITCPAEVECIFFTWGICIARVPTAGECAPVQYEALCNVLYVVTTTHRFFLK